MMKTKSLYNKETKTDLIEAMLIHVPFDGWTWDAMEQGALDIGFEKKKTPSLRIEIFKDLFKNGPIDFIDTFSEVIDLEVKENYVSIENKPERVPEKIKKIIMIRLNLCLKYKEAIRSSISITAIPANAKTSINILYRTCDSIWKIAGDKSTDFSFYTRRITLAAVYSSTLLFWLNDKSNDSVETEFFLNRRLKDITNISSSNNISIIGSKAIKVKNVTQFKYIETIENSTITFGIGPAGTGKTFLAVACAVKMYTDEKIKKIVLTRPAVEAGERLGYLPGDLSQKIDPYLVPLFDSLEYFFGNETLQYLIEKRNIEIVPLAYMRGRTLNNACIILDEAQNATVSQIKMFLTRLGEDSKMIITGDETQIDLHNRDFSGLKKTRKSLSNIEEISVVEFKNSDIVRNKIVSKILEVFPDK